MSKGQDKAALRSRGALGEQEAANDLFQLALAY